MFIQIGARTRLQPTEAAIMITSVVDGHFWCCAAARPTEPLRRKINEPHCRIGLVVITYIVGGIDLQSDGRWRSGPLELSLSGGAL